MSARENPDFWRSQGGGDEKKPQNGTPSTPSSPLTDNMRNAQSSARNSKGVGDSSNTAGDSTPAPSADPSISTGESPKSPKRVSASRPPSTPGTTPKNAASAIKSGMGEGLIGAAGDAAKRAGAPERVVNTAEDIANKQAAKKVAPPVKTPAKIAEEKKVKPPEVISKETLGAAAKEGLKQGVKGGVKGAIATKSPQGAGIAAGVGAAAGAADKINEAAAARKQAGQTRGPSNANGLLAAAAGDKMADKALASERAAALRKYGGTTAGASKSKLPINVQQAKSIGKASITVQREMRREAGKKAGIAIGVVGLIFYTTVSSVIGATTAPLAAAIIPITADDAKCEAPESVTVGSPSPGDKGTDEGLTPDAKKVRAYINSQWGGKIADIYGVRQGANAMDHASGRALDIMIPNYSSAEGKALGNEISKYFQDHSKEYGIDYLIFDNKIWANGKTPDQSWSYAANANLYGPKDWAPYGATSNDTQKHLDHVHISVVGTASSGTTTVSYNATAQSLDMTRASNIAALTRVPAPMVSFSELNSNPTKYGLVADSTKRAEQLANARAIIGKAKAIGFNKEGAIIGVMTAMTESDLINVNHGDDARNPDGTMNTSLGLFQQQHGNMGWGTKEEVMNPSHSSQAFFLGTVKGNPGLQSLADWKTIDPWMAAQKVQRSAFGDGSNYKADYESAKEIVDALYSSTDSSPIITGGTAKTADGSLNTDTSTDGCNTVTGGDGTTGSVAAGDTYPARNESYCRTSLCYAMQSADSVSGAGYRGECVDWTGWKILEYSGLYGTHRVAAVGNATDWGPAMRAKGFSVDMNPVAGDAIYWTAGSGGSGSAGHIGTVQSVNGDGTVTIEEYNYGIAFPGDTPATGGGRYHTRTISINDASGYIHLIDPSKSKEENVKNLISKGVLVEGKGTWPRK